MYIQICTVQQLIVDLSETVIILQKKLSPTQTCRFQLETLKAEVSELAVLIEDIFKQTVGQKNENENNQKVT